MPAFRKVPTEIAAAWQKARPAPARRGYRLCVGGAPGPAVCEPEAAPAGRAAADRRCAAAARGA